MNQFQSASDEGGKVWGQGYDVCMYVIYIMMMLWCGYTVWVSTVCVCALTYFINGSEVIKWEINPRQSGGGLHKQLAHGGQEVLPVSQHVVVHPQSHGSRLLHHNRLSGAFSWELIFQDQLQKNGR